MAEQLNILVPMNGGTVEYFSHDEWRELLSDFKSGVDYPISFFYKEILEAYPNVKVD